MRIGAVAFAGLAMLWVPSAPLARAQSNSATPRATPSLINGGNRPPFYGELVIGAHSVKFDSPECGEAIQVAIREGHPDPRMSVPTAFCQKELNEAMAYLKELPAETPAPETPAARYTPGPPSQ